MNVKVVLIFKVNTTLTSNLYQYNLSHSEKLTNFTVVTKENIVFLDNSNIFYNQNT